MDLKTVLSARFPGVHAVHDFAKKLSTHHWITMWDEKDEGFNNASLMFLYVSGPADSGHVIQQYPGDSVCTN